MWNIHADMLPDTKLHSLKQHIMRLRPRAVLILNNPGYAIEVKRAVPNTNVIYRKWIDPAGDNTGDNNLHLKFGAREMNNIYRAEIPVSEGVIYHYGNEPGTGDDLFEWSNEAAIYTVETKAYGCYLNFSPGVPEPFDWRKPSALKFLRTIASNRQRHIVGLHEYMPSVNWWEFGFTQNPASWANKVNGKSWLMGRYRDLLAACDENRITRPRIVMTEHGFDYIPASASFQNNLPVAPECRNRQPPEKAGALWCNTEYWQQILPAGYTWPQYMMEMLHWVHRAIYRWDAEIEGVCNYCYGAQGGSRWEMYDHSRLPNIFELMESKDWTMATTPTPTPQPTTETYLSDATWRFNVRIRATPNTSATIKGSIPAGKRAQITGAAHVNQGFIWTPIVYNGVSGWSALGEVETPATPAPAPDDDEPSIEGICDGFDQPVGSAADRASSEVWAGGWIDANPFLNLTPGKSYHTGSDLNLNVPTWDSDKLMPFYACADGVVIWAQSFRVWGNLIILKHAPLPDGTVMYSRYAHSETIEVRVGDAVKRGDKLGLIGNADGSMAYHLHFDIVKTAVLEHKPTDWPGLDRARIEQNYVNPKIFIWKNRPRL